MGSSAAASCGPEPEGLSSRFIAPQYGLASAACTTDPGPWEALRVLAGSGTHLGGIAGVRVVEDAHLTFRAGRAVGGAAQHRGLVVVGSACRRDELAGAGDAARLGFRFADVDVGTGG